MLCINRPFFCCLNICQITCIRHLLSLFCMDYCNSLQISLHTPALSLIHSRVVCSLLRVTLLKSKSEPIPTQLKTSVTFLGYLQCPILMFDLFPTNKPLCPYFLSSPLFIQPPWHILCTPNPFLSQGP